MAHFKYGERKRLPDVRHGYIHRAVIQDIGGGGEFDLYIRANYYPDTSELGEIFLNVSKQGTTLQGYLDSWAITLSVALQHGTPLEELATKFDEVQFPPYGPTDDSNIPFCSSLIDYVVKWLVRQQGIANKGQPPVVAENEQASA